MTNEPFEILDQALREVESESHHLREMIAQIHLHNTPEGNRRSVSPKGFWAERRRGERRGPQRATAGRRELPDRRLPTQERVLEWHSQLAKVLERSMELNRLRRHLRQT